MFRDDKIDGVKALLIFAMVLGHMSYIDYGIGINKMIYAFHMPAFVFLSGYFTSAKNDIRKFLKWCLISFSIYMCAQWAQCLYSALLPFIRHGEIGSIRIKEIVGLHPRFSLWYILSLIFWRIAIAIMRDRLSPKVLLAISISALIVGGMVSVGNQLSFQRTLAFAPFFVLGYLFKVDNFDIKFSRIPFSVCVLIVPVILMYTRYLPTFVPSNPYVIIPYDMVLRMFQSFLALVLTFCIIRILCAFQVEKLSRWGRYTLWVYIGHAIPITFQNLVVDRFCIFPNMFMAIIISAGYVVVITLIAEWWQRIKSRKAE